MLLYIQEPLKQDVQMRGEKKKKKPNSSESEFVYKKKAKCLHVNEGHLVAGKPGKTSWKRW